MRQSALLTVLGGAVDLARWRTLLIAVVAILVMGIGGAPDDARGAEPVCQGEAATLVGTLGDDTIRGTSGPDVIVGLEGDDTISGLGGADTICGKGGEDTLRGGAAADRVNGGPQPDSVAGGKGDDRLFGGPGQAWDTLEGGEGDDLMAGGEGIGDMASYANAAGPVSADLRSDSATGQGSDSLPAIEALEGSPFGDLLRGDEAFNNISGRGGDDRITGGAGTSNLVGGPGADTIHGGREGDSMFGNGGDDKMFGNGSFGVGSATLSDDFFGGPGDDEQWGSDGQDVFWSSSPECCDERRSAGADTIRAFGQPLHNPDAVFVDDGVGDDFVDCGADGGSATADAGDTLINCDRTTAGAFDRRPNDSFVAKLRTATPEP